MLYDLGGLIFDSFFTVQLIITVFYCSLKYKAGSSMENLQIRNIEREEFKELRKDLINIYRRAYRGLEKYAYDKNSLVKNYLNWLYRGDPKGFFVAFVEGKPVGFVSGHKHWFWAGKLWGEVHEIVVEPGYQHKGIGKALMTMVIDYLKSQEDVRIGLWVGIDNEHAKNFYRKLGFRPEVVYDKWERWVLSP